MNAGQRRARAEYLENLAPAERARARRQVAAERKSMCDPPWHNIACYTGDRTCEEEPSWAGILARPEVVQV